MQQKDNQIALLTGIAAAIIYGAWAVYANFEHGKHAWVMAGLVQAAYAFISTFSITHVARWSFYKFKAGISGFIAGFIISFIVMLLIPLTVHSLAQTPDILETMLPGLIWGSMYIIIFLKHLIKR